MDAVIPNHHFKMERAQEVTRGAIESIFRSGNANTKPVVQVIDLKRISSAQNNTSNPPRFRLAISDGTHFQQAMIATQLNALIADNTLQVNSLIRLHEIICNTVQDKRIVIILNVEIITQLPAKIGNPVSIDAVMSGGALTAIQGPPQPQPQHMARQPLQQFPNQGNFAQQKLVPNGNAMQYGAPSNGVAYGQGVVRGPPVHPSPQGFGQGGFGAPTNTWNAPNGVANHFANRGSTAITKTPSAPSSMYRPISSINPYQNGWTIRGRCTFKSDLRRFQNARGEGQVISFEVTDESGSIRVTGFTQNAQRINDVVHMNRIYKVSRGFLKQANERFNRSTSSFEMTIDNNSVLEEIEDDGSFMQIKYNFIKIADLESVEVKGNCDVVGVVTDIGPLSEIVIRSTNEPCARRSITIIDDSNTSVELTLWRSQAETFLTEDAIDRHPIILLRNAVRGDFGGVSLNVSRMTTLELDPVNIPEANQLRAWFDSGGPKTSNVQSVTAGPGGGGKIIGPRKSLVEARIEEVEPTFSQQTNQENNGTATFVTRGMVTFINTKNDLYYPGDPETKKKVIEQGGGMWMSESTGRQLGDHEIVWRYIVSMKIADQSASHWVSGFDEVGQVLFGRSAQQLRTVKSNDETLCDHIVEDALCRPMLFKVQVKERTWREARQIRYTVARAEPIDFAAESKVLLQEISSYGGF